MAISDWNGCLDLFREALVLAGKPLPQLAIAELGNQRVKTVPGSGMRRMQSHGSLLRHFGAAYICLDINGRDGALPVDLSQPWPPDVSERYAGWADIVTNFGTSEHVSAGQFEAFRTMHRLCRVGGLLVHAVPASGTCRRHGSWKYTVEWFQQLAATNRYEVISCAAWDKSLGMPERLKPREQIYLRVLLRRISGRRFRGRGWVDPPRK